MVTLGLEEADSKMHVQRTGSGYEAVQTDLEATFSNVQYSYGSLRRRSDGQAGKKHALPGEVRFDAFGYGLREESGCQIGSQPRP